MKKSKTPFSILAREFITDEKYTRVMTKNAYVSLILLASVADQNWVVQYFKPAALAKSYGISLSNFYSGLNTLKELGFVISDSQNLMLVEQQKLLNKPDSKGFIKVPLAAVYYSNFTGVSLRAVRILLFLLSSQMHKKPAGGNFKYKTFMLNCGINRPAKVKKALKELSYIINVMFDHKDCRIEFKEEINDENVFCTGEYLSRRQKTYRYFKHTDKDYKTLAILAHRYTPGIIFLALREAVKRSSTVEYFSAYLQKVCKNILKQMMYPVVPQT